MSTPAEIIAARYSTEPEDVAQSYEEEQPVAVAAPSSTSSASGFSTPSLADESAFPTLGGASGVSSTPTWVKPGSVPASSVSSAGSNGSTSAPGPAPAAALFETPKLASNGNSGLSNGGSRTTFKSSTIQDAFSLDTEDQLNVTRPEFIKLLTSIKTETKTNIECTTSQHTKKRTFLITGKPQDVKLAKRLVIKKLTRPVTISFSIPAKVRSKVIGPQGRVLKPIIQANEVRVDIGSPQEETADETTEVSAEDSDEDDIYSQTVQVTIEGDVEGCKHAKAQIQAIVREATKSLTIKIPIADIVKPFAAKGLSKIVESVADVVDVYIPDNSSNSTTILLSGDREAALAVKPKIIAELVNIELNLSVEEVPIPKLKHQFLPTKQILDLFNVLIKLPGEGETNVKFVGQKKNIKLAQEEARKTTSQYKVEVLDMSKAHKGNISHVKAVALYLSKIGSFKEIGRKNEVIINAPSIDQLQSEETTSSIPIEIISKNDQAENTKAAKKAIVSTVNKISPEVTKVVSDIDEFFLPKVPQAINSVSKENNVEYVILGNTITLFVNEEASNDEENEDFEDFEDSSKSLESLNKVDQALNEIRELAKTLDSKSLKFGKDEVSRVSGPRGTTLNAILKEVSPNSVLVKLKDNGEVFIHGTKTEVATIVKEIEQVVKDGAEAVSTSIEVPSFVLSRLIGKNGSNLNSLQDEFAVKINVDNQQQSSAADEDKSSKTNISISGVKKNVESCKSRISDFAKRWADETLTRVRVEEQYHRKIIGAAGVYINRLQDKYNVKIRFPSSDGSASTFADAPRNKDEVTIKGPSRGVAKAEEELRELYQFEKENGFKKTLQIPSKAVARVIGKSGETINDIADGSGVEYRFNRDLDEKELGYIELELTGSKAALKSATEKIEEIIEEIENFVTVSIDVDPKYHRNLIGQGGSVMREIIAKAGGENISRPKYHKLLIIPDEGNGSREVVSKGDKSIVNKVIEQVKAIIALKEAAVTEEYELPKEKHRLVVGTGGYVRQTLQEKFNCTINVPKPDSSSTVLKLEGLPEDLAKLKIELDEVTKDDWNEAIDIPEKFHTLVSERGAIFGYLKNEFNVDVQHGNTQSKANKLSKAKIPTPPESATSSDDSNKFTIVEGIDFASDSDDIIVWRLKGEKADTAKAAKYIESRLSAAQAATSTGWYYFQKSSSVSKIIGPRGAKLNKIRKVSNCFITVPKPKDENDQFVYLIGSENGLEIARKEIEKAI